MKNADGQEVQIVYPHRSDPLVRYAVEECQRYVHLLFGFHPEIVEAPTGPHLHIGPHPDFPSLGDQEYMLKRQKRDNLDALICAGGSPQATLWAVYELVEHWGVRYLLHEDVIPSPSSFVMPDIDTEARPALPIRTWPLGGDLAISAEAWTADDCMRLIDQLAKLRFNRIAFGMYAYYQPFLDFQYKGIRREQAGLFYGYHFPVTDDMIGRELFGDAKEFWNPDLPLNASYQEQLEAGQAYMHSLFAHAHARGMTCGIDAMITEFPLEFASVVPSAQRMHQLGALAVVPGGDVMPEDPELIELASVMLRTVIDTYPEADYVDLSMPEFRQWVGQYERAWKALDEKYHVERVRPLEEVLVQASRRVYYPGGGERAVQEVKGDIVNLLFFDRLLNETCPQRTSRRPDIKFVLHGVAEELSPILPHILGSGWETINLIDYTPDRILKRLDQIIYLRDQDVPFCLYYTLHDDNVGVLPQLSTGSLNTITGALLRNNWSGFRARYKMIGDHDTCVNFLSKVAWNPLIRPDEVTADLVSAIGGPDCVADMLDVFREVEAATILLEWHGLGITFPTDEMLTRHWITEPFSRELAQVREHYERALQAGTRAVARVTPDGRRYVDYWIGRLRFGARYMDMIECCRLAAKAEADEKYTEAHSHTRRAIDFIVTATKTYAAVAQDQSDRGAIAVINEFVYRALRRKADELEDAAGQEKGKNDG